MNKSHSTGRLGEEEATHYLQRQGHTILARNWRSKRGGRESRPELDIVSQDGDTIVFVEVKTRTAGGLSSPADAITQQKRARIIRAAQAWLAEQHAWAKPCRFDVICIIQQATSLTVEHTAHAFDASSFMDSGHTAWQPW
jgi:putative endonuclease